MLEHAPDVLTIKDLQKVLQIGRNSALHLVKTKKIPACKVMGKWRILKEDVANFLLNS